MPVLNGSAFKNKACNPSLGAVIDYLPAPTEVAAIKGHKMGTEETVERHNSDDEPFAALAFKIMTDPYVGTLTYIRTYSGVLESGTQILNTVKNKKERIGRMLEMHANTREDVQGSSRRGYRCARRLKDTTTGGYAKQCRSSGRP